MIPFGETGAFQETFKAVAFTGIIVSDWTSEGTTKYTYRVSCCQSNCFRKLQLYL
jgi:hypothetical protein